MRGFVLKPTSGHPRRFFTNWTFTVQFFSFGLALLSIVPSGLKGQTPSPSKVIFQSPRSALIHSAILPGWGQWRNGQHLKSILVFGGETALVANAVSLGRLAARSATAEERTFYKDNQSLSIWWFFGVYFLNLLDAYVDAQLRVFDTSPDLSRRLPCDGSPSFGLAISIPIGS
jgi:hypothetical protein